jgi:Flp pilus assembly protein TadD
MNASAAGRERLARLEASLQQDPANAALLADACDTATACGALDLAQLHIEAAQRLRLDPATWMFRRSRLAIARGELDVAAMLLEQLRSCEPPRAAIDHDLAHVRLLQGDGPACCALVQPWLERAGTLAPEELQAVQVLWVRALHAQERLDEAWDWVRQQEGAGRLLPAARGVASLLAVDLDELEAADALADAALASDPTQADALVARASVWLAAGNIDGAQQLLQRVLERQPRDGRSWWLLGTATLMQRDFPLARSQLERAVEALPAHAGAWQALGWASLLCGEREAAVAAFERASALDTETQEADLPTELARALLEGEAPEPQLLQALREELLDADASFGPDLRAAVTSRTPRLH